MRGLITLVLFLAFLIPSGACAEEFIKKGELLNLERCIELALKKHPNIAASAGTVDANRSKVEEAKANYYPQISLSTAYSRVSPLLGATISSTGSSATQTTEGSNTDYNYYSGSVTLKQTIYDFGKVSSQIKVQALTLDSSRSDLSNVEQQTVFNVQQAYYGILKAKRSMAVAEETVNQYKEHLKQAKGFFEAGTKPKFDVTKAEVDLSTAKLNLIKADNALRLAITTLNNALGIPEAPEYTIEDNLSFHRYDVIFNKALEQAYSSRPDLKATTAKKMAAEESISLAKKDYYPTLSGSATYTKAGKSFPLDNGWNAGLTLSIPLFSGFLTKNQVEEAKANLRTLTANEEALRQTVFLELQQAYLNLKEAEERIPAAELALKQARENLDIANGRYAAGVGSPIEVTDAEVSLSNANTAYIQALYDYKLYYASIEKAMGAGINRAYNTSK